MNRDTDEETV